ncbi:MULTISPECIES: glycosyltransferase family 2 protein [unclassified Acinetobacter]|uniref:glycosyltransferase family 2 protein n=1 Tax=Acinetobacter TaxID=469 RepID=UPI002574E515|nr:MULTISPECIES: glycosyltransferase family 2 protein [unclassified Acinetobacter]MDM1757766.1 glycosyltransferase family 2 protein [Acinetobacter sp. 256-1]MDM1761862.1 glycosyltransferase family 2 protein [Acinetobacter sp. 251-1]
MAQYGFVIPVYNHPHYIQALLEHLNDFALPVIMVNDGSDAECTQLLHMLDQQFEHVILVEHAMNQGKGQAVMTGLQKAFDLGLSHALQIDADGQHDWQDIAKFLQISQQHPKAMVIGQPIFDDTVPKKRLYGRYATHIWVWINSLSFDIKDSMCGFRIYPLAATIQILNTAKFQARMGFDSEILVRLKWENIPFINVPTKVIYPEQGISHFHVWRDNLGMSQAHSRLFAGMLLRLPKLLKNKYKGSADV